MKIKVFSHSIYIPVNHITCTRIYLPKRCILFFQPKKTKNISRDAFGTKHGRVHMQKQDITKLQTRKMKGLKRAASDKKTADSGSGEKKKRIEEDMDSESE